MELTPTLAAIRAFCEERDWRQFHNPKDLTGALSIEVAELMEIFLWKDIKEIPQVLETRRSEIESEIADIAVYLTAVIHRKLEENREKYPVEKSRGNAKKYTELR